ncbi:DUF2996 domain-containing protein [Romeria aff. gracilis LEGE 07310]|uniref:DUF2996 domain-containing protein n=2 Tax=Vasconcelosia TaxID=3366328 RepID=A0A8J7DLZ9_9CYAN|nr:DUF2996 domain-containing protein [Romeria aff. gracilis LEGE 07310]
MAEENTSKNAENSEEKSTADKESAAKESSAEQKSEKAQSDDQKAAKSGGKSAAKSAAKSGSKSDSKSGGKSAAKKKEKPPKLEDKPFTEFMQQHYLPSLEEALKAQGADDLQLEFAKRQLAVLGFSDPDEYWQVMGQWKDGRKQFNIAFMDEDISGTKVFSYATAGDKPSTIEQFMGDERRITLDLMVLYTLQRLNAQKWLTRN